MTNYTVAVIITFAGISTTLILCAYIARGHKKYKHLSPSGNEYKSDQHHDG